ncbi:MAG: hypothetical protein N4A41_04495 [Crocinitomicaceae bacterium]|nr:hypothetical protein [Crocinitomicaceae bacterium]
MEVKKNAILSKVLLFLAINLLVVACKSDSSVEEEVMTDEPAQEEVLAEVEKDLSKNVPLIEEGVDRDFKENKKKIEKKYGNQWDFCRCVVANDSIDKVVKSGVDLDQKFMDRFEEIDAKCKAFLVMNPNNTPEERQLHERKIQECLKANKK